MLLSERDRGSHAPWLVLAGLLLALGAWRLWLASEIPTPWIMIDEIIYSELAESFAESGSLRVRGQDTPFYSLLYPVLISPAWLAGSMETTYAVAKTINVLVMSLAAIPTYLLARRPVSRWAALVVAALVLLMPSFLYTGMLMTENAFLPVFLLAALAMVSALERPTWQRQTLVLLAIALASAVRLQGLVLFGVYLTAIGLKLLLDHRAGVRPSLRPFSFSAAALAITAGLLLATTLGRGRPLIAPLGAYQATVDSGYSLGSVADWTMDHAAELGLAVGFVPLSAFLGVLVLAVTRGAVPGERAFLAVTAAALPWMVVSVAAFASQNSLRIEERYLFYLTPLLLVALAVWLERGRPRSLLAFAVGLVPLLLVVVFPLGRFINVEIYADTFALHPLFWLEQHLGFEQGQTRALVVGVAALCALLFALLPLRRARVVLPVLVAAIFVATQVGVFAVVRDHASTLVDPGRMGDKRWLETQLGQDQKVVFLWTGQPDPSVLWQIEFWNRNLEAVYRLASEPGDPPATEARIDERTGQLLAEPSFAEPDLLLTDHTLVLSEQPLEVFASLRLYALRETTRIVGKTEGVYADSWVGPSFRYTQFGCVGPGWLSLTLGTEPALGLPEQSVVAREGDAELASATVAAGEVVYLPVPVEGAQGSCAIDVAVDETAVPAEVVPGSADRRELGLRLHSAEYVPRG